MKTKILKSFKYGGEKYEEGKTEEFSENVFKKLKEKGYVEEEESDELEIEDMSASKSMGDNIPGEIKGELEEDLDRKPASPDKWNPAKADKPDPSEHPDLIGRVRRVGVSSEYGTKFMNVETDDGVYSLWGHTALENLWTDGSPEPGDYVGVSYLGTESSKEYGEYLNYRYVLRDKDGNIKVEG